jgi:putative molybdopterin biosynthesis protein
LTDYLLKKENIDGKSILGYGREEYTHMSVAAKIASGFADAGIGIYSASKIYDLDFVQLAKEKYDFIAPYDYIKDGTLDKFLNILSGKIFAKKLQKLGGYSIEQPGIYRIF